jgi:uncharacterized damage-inducible protein DinB
MNPIIKFRNNGAIGALLDEYEKSVGELIAVINGISQSQLIAVADPETNDEYCKSIQGILTHIVHSGYAYVVKVRKLLGEEISNKDKEMLWQSEDYVVALRDMFRFNEQLFEDYPNITLNETDPHKKIIFSQGQQYDVEQLFEHAIVHILRHRRQIEKFKVMME